MIKNLFSCVSLLICLLFSKAGMASTVVITSAKDSVCENGSLLLKGNVTSGTVSKWKWSSNNSSGVTFAPNDSAQNITATFPTAGTDTIKLVVTYTTGVTDSMIKIITVIPNANALFSTSLLAAGIPKTVTFTNASLNAPNGFSWSFGDNNSTSVQQNPTHIYTTAGVYTITLMAYGLKGCNDTLSTLLLITDTVGLSMPNVFTPNGDGINDYFLPNAHGMQSYNCTIYDRWGSKIADLDMLNQAYWDGYTTSGLACTEGTYYYTLKATDVNGKTYSLKGFVQLIH